MMQVFRRLVALIACLVALAAASDAYISMYASCSHQSSYNNFDITASGLNKSNAYWIGVYHTYTYVGNTMCNTWLNFAKLSMNTTYERTSLYVADTTSEYYEVYLFTVNATSRWTPGNMGTCNMLSSSSVYCGISSPPYSGNGSLPPFVTTLIVLGVIGAIACVVGIVARIVRRNREQNYDRLGANGTTATIVSPSDQQMQQMQTNAGYVFTAPGAAQMPMSYMATAGPGSYPSQVPGQPAVYYIPNQGGQVPTAVYMTGGAMPGAYMPATMTGPTQ